MQKEGMSWLSFLAKLLGERAGAINFGDLGEFLSMSGTSNAADALEERIEALIRYAEKLRLEKKELEERNEELAGTIQEKERRIGELEAKVEELTRAGSASPAQRKEAEKRIDGVIREIDRCIALLERG